MPLNDRTVKALKWEGKDKRVCDSNGLYLNIRKSSKTWIARRRQKTAEGTRTIMKTLGQYPEISLKQARVLASQAALKPGASNVLVRELVDEYMVKVVHRSHKRPHFVQGYMDRAVLPLLGKRKVIEVTRFELAHLIKQYSASRGARTADQLRSNLKAMFGYAVELGYRDDNPMSDMTRRVSGYEDKPRDRVLTDKEIRLIWADNHCNMPMLRFLLLTGLRISEARLGEQSGDRWLVSADISKNGKPHWVHLTDEAKKQLPLPRCTATNIQAWLRRWCDNREISPRFTPHDLRRTAATRMADAGVSPFVVERMLNHTLQGVMKVYNQAEYEKDRVEAARSLESLVVSVVSNQDG